MKSFIHNQALSAFIFSVAIFAAKGQNKPSDDGTVDAPAEVLGGAFGLGEQFKFNPDAWPGDEQVITRLKKAAVVYDYVRKSRDEYVIRQVSPEKRDYFRFLPSESSISPDVRTAVLVDLVHNEHQVAALFLSANGYFYIKSSAETPRLKPPKHYFPNKALSVGDWVPRLMSATRDFYPELGGIPISEKVAAVKLVATDKIEFVLRDMGFGEQRDVFIFDDFELKKNGFRYEIYGYADPVPLDYLEEDSLLEVSRAKDRLKSLRFIPTSCGYEMTEFLAIVSRFKDQTAAAEISERTKQAFSSANSNSLPNK